MLELKWERWELNP